MTESSERLLERSGVDVGAARERRRAFALACLDWTERRSHLAGALGAELCDRLFELGWVERPGSSRAAALTEAGEAELSELLELDLDRSATRRSRTPADSPRRARHSDVRVGWSQVMHLSIRCSGIVRAWPTGSTSSSSATRTPTSC